MSEHTVTKASATKRVLIVDDDSGVLNVLRDCFAAFQHGHGHSYEITTAGSASEAFTILRRERFDLILTDVVIPAADRLWLSNQNLGLGLLTRFRDLGVTAPVLMMTAGRNDAAKEAEALNVGAAGYLYKPIDVQELYNAVARVLGSSPR